MGAERTDELASSRVAGVDWAAAVEAAPDAVAVLDAGGGVVALNAAATRLFGWPVAEAAGRSVDLFQPETAGLRLSAVLAAAPERLAPRDFACATRGGDGLTVEVAAARIGAGPAAPWVVLFRDASDRQVVADALLHAEQRLASVTANLPGIVFQRVMHTDGSLYYPFFTSGVRTVLGYEPDDMRMTADGCLDVVHWADRVLHMEAVRRSGAALEPCVEEFRAITRDGEVRWLQGTSRPQRLADGAVLWDGVLIDVTERKRAELHLQMIMDHAADSVVTFTERGRIESANAAAAALFGYAVVELIGQDVAVLMPDPSRGLHAATIRAYLDSGASKVIGQGPAELLGRRKDGTTFPLDMATSEVRLDGRLLFIGIGRDVTLRKQTEAALYETEQRLRLIAANMPGLVFQRVLRLDGAVDFTYVSDGCRAALGVEPEELVADSSLFFDALAPHDRDRFMTSLLVSAETLEPLDEEVRVETRHGAQRWLRGQSRPRPLPSGEVAWDGILLDVTDRKRAEEQLLFLAYYDPLTGVPNRALYLDRFAQAQARAGGSGIAVVSLGIDRFAVVNSTLGHSKGDAVLRSMGQRLFGAIDQDDTLARVSGDRFLVMLTGVAGEVDAIDRVERLLAVAHEPLTIDDEEFDLTISAGLALSPRDGTEAETLIRNADAALLRSKAQGGGVRLFTAEMNQIAVHSLSLQHRLRRAIENQEFVAFYQPQVEVKSGRIVGMEALVRWMPADGDMVSPAEFIPVAEESGLIEGICEQMLAITCRQNRAWQLAGLAVPVAVNISGRQFQQPRRLVQTLEAVLQDTGLAPSLLELELTESSAMREPEVAIGVIRRFNDMGLHCAIDDFGTGYSSLSVLKSFPIRKLKIDRSFVMDVHNDANDAAIVAAIIAMAHALRLTVVAEGVELKDHLDFLRGLGCDQIQGYYFSRPLPAAAMEQMLVARRNLAHVGVGA